MIESLGSLLAASGHGSEWRSWENLPKSSPLHDHWYQPYGGPPTASGIHVSPDSAIGLAAVYRCISIIADAVAMMPLLTYRNLGDGRKERARDHYAYDLLTKRVNPTKSAFRWKRQQVAWILGWGNAFSVMQVSPNGRVVALWPVHPAYVTWKPKEQVYEIGTQNGPMPVDRDMMLHFRGLETDDSDMGKSIVRLARESIALGKAQEQFNASFYGRGATMSGFFKVPEDMGEDAKKNMLQYIQSTYEGPSNWRRMGILDGGVSFERLQVDPVDAQFMANLVHTTREVGRWFGVQPHMLGDMEGAKYSNLSDQKIDFAIHCLGPYLEGIAAEINCSLFSVTEGKSVFVEFNQGALLKGNPKEQAEIFNIMRQNGVLSADEWRSFLNMNPIGGPQGTTYFVNGNMANTASQIAAPQSNQEKPL